MHAFYEQRVSVSRPNEMLFFYIVVRKSLVQWLRTTNSFMTVAKRSKEIRSWWYVEYIVLESYIRIGSQKCYNAGEYYPQSSGVFYVCMLCICWAMGLGIRHKWRWWRGSADLAITKRIKLAARVEK